MWAVAMDTPVISKRVYRFGLFEVDVESGKLLRQGTRVKLQDQPFRLLCLLLERAGQVVTREELRQSLWSGNTYVEFDGSLNAALKRLRYALGDAADNPIFVETLPKRGYRFLAPVAVDESACGTLLAAQSKFDVAPPGAGEELIEDATSESYVGPEIDPGRGPLRRRLVFGLILALLAGLGVA